MATTDRQPAGALLNRITGSRYWLAKICLHAFTGGWEWEEGSSYASRAGSAFHYVAARVSHDIIVRWLYRGRLDELDAYMEEAIAKYNLTPAQRRDLPIQVNHLLQYLKDHPIVGWQTEVGYFYQPSHSWGEELKMAFERDYSLAPVDAIAMSLDVLEIRQGGVGLVADYKTGYRVDGAVDSDQLKIAALAVSKAHGLHEVEIQIIKVRAKEGLYVLPHTLDQMDLDMIEMEVADVFANIKNNPGPVPGEHCNRCPAKMSCPDSQAKKAA